MNKYKFGNHICRLRENKGLTQYELAQVLNVSDKAVSKWENGQSVPRMETFEAMAAALDTSVEELLAISKDDVTVIYIKNDFCPLADFKIDGKIYSLKENESTYIEVDKEKFTLEISGELMIDELNDELDEIMQDEKGIKNKIFNKVAKKAVNYASKSFLLVECTYTCQNYTDGQIITVSDDLINLGDVALTYENFLLFYPKPQCDGVVFKLQKAQGKNVKEYVKKMKKAGFVSDIGLSFIEMILFYPLRGIYFNHLCKPHILKKHIIDAEKIKAKNSRKKPIGCLSVIGIIFIALCVMGALDIVLTPYTTPAVVSADYSTVKYYNDTYKRIDELPEDATPTTFLDATQFYDAINNGNSRLDQWAEDSKVQTFTDPDGNQYLWLIENYTDTVLAEDKEYDDFQEHYVYIFKPNS